MDTVRWAWRTRIIVHLSIDLRMRLWQAAEDEAVRVFAANLRDLLLAAPAGARPVIGLDPGFRTGVKVAVVDATGKVMATETIYPHEPRRRWDEAVAVLARLARAHRVELIAIGNGTASRETDKLAGEVIKLHPELGLTKIMVSEAGASVYSASAYASRELPGLDVSLRGAVSIARRLQDPLAELVKIDPKSIGVGQYQHDLSEAKLSQSLDAVVEDCVNAVGVDVNTASAPLLARVSGISDGLARASSRTATRAGRSARGGRSRPCPASARRRSSSAPVSCASPLATTRLTLPPCTRRRIRWCAGSSRPRVATSWRLIGKTSVLRGLKPAEFADGTFGIPTVTDILEELEKPGRDPRPAFTTASFKEGVETLADLRAGMVLEGVVTNVAAFGAFVDVGVHQDGLVHISAMSKGFVADPREVVKPGDVVRVKVLGVDIARKRIALTLRLDDEVGGAGGGASGEAASGGSVPGRSGGARGAGGKRAQPDVRSPDGDRAQSQGPSSGQSRHAGSGRNRGGSGGRGSGGGSGGRGSGSGSGSRESSGGALADALRRAGLV